MTKVRPEENTKPKSTSTKKTKPKETTTPKKSLDTLLKNHQNESAKNKADLHNAMAEIRDLNSLIVDKNKSIVELEKSVKDAETEIQKINNDLNLSNEKKDKIMQDFAIFSENYYKLESLYDTESKKRQQENDDLTAELHKWKDVARDSEEKLNILNIQLLESVRSFEEVKKDFERKHNEFEYYKKQVEDEKRIYDERVNLDFSNLKKELFHKDEMLKQCLIQKEQILKDKTHIIDELNQKIHRIQGAIAQPTRAIQPMIPSLNAAVPNKTNDNQNNTQNSINNVAITKPQERQPLLENVTIIRNPIQTSINNEIPSPDNNFSVPPPGRQYKFKRPIPKPTNSQSTITATPSGSVKNNTRKRRGPNVRQQSKVNLNLPATANINEFSTSTDDESDDDSIFASRWRPKSFVPESTSDASEGFAKAKRFKK